MTIRTTLISLCLLPSAHIAAAAEPLAILNLPGSGTDPGAIDFENLPRLKGTHGY